MWKKLALCLALVGGLTLLTSIQEADAHRYYRGRVGFNNNNFRYSYGGRYGYNHTPYHRYNYSPYYYSPYNRRGNGFYIGTPNFGFSYYGR